MKALDVSNAIISLSSPEYGDVITNLKLQKLLYYSQGFHLAMKNKPLFDEDLQAWQYGPVVPEVYHEFKRFGSGAIILGDDVKIEMPQKKLELLKEIYDVYGQFSALKLMQMTHSELPWKSTKMNEVISHEKLVSYFKKLVK